MVCPICEKTVIFPAVPPGGKGQSLHIKRPQAVRAAKGSFNLDDILAALRQFEHWNMVLLCLVPFVIVAALLIGAAVVKKKAGDEPAMPVAPPIQADANAWQTMTNLARADQLVQDQIGAVTRAIGAVNLAQRNRANLQAYFHGSPSGQSSYIAADQALTRAQAALSAARLSFIKAFQNYQQLGGKIDYSRQLPQ